MSASERLKLIRADLGKTQKEVAALLGISYRTLQNYEDGVNAPSWDACEALARLGYDANWLLTGEGQMKRVEAPAPGLVGEVVGEYIAGRRVTDNLPDRREREYTRKLITIFRTKDEGTISAITQNIDTFLRVPGLLPGEPPPKKAGGE